MNIYDDPEKFGLAVIAELDDPTASYSFDMVVFWSKGAQVYAGADSGCSCPTPFDGQGIGDLTEIRTVQQAQEFIEGMENPVLHFDAGEKRDVLATVANISRSRFIPLGMSYTSV